MNDLSQEASNLLSIAFVWPLYGESAPSSYFRPVENVSDLRTGGFLASTGFYTGLFLICMHALYQRKNRNQLLVCALVVLFLVVTLHVGEPLPSPPKTTTPSHVQMAAILSQYVYTGFVHSQSNLEAYFAHYHKPLIGVD